MQERRQQVLLGILILIVGWFGGEYMWVEYVRNPLVELEDEYTQMTEDVTKNIKRMKATKKLPKRIDAWKRQALPADTETARSLYRNWLLETIRGAKLQNTRVDSGFPNSRAGFRVLPVNAQARGTLAQITDALFAFENAALLHKVVNIRLTPIGTTGQFDLAMGIEAVIMPKVRRRSLKPGKVQRLVSKDRRAYDVITRDNIFGISVDHRDPMQLTRLTGVVARNGVLQAWITEEIPDKVHKLSVGGSFDTAALSGRIVEVHDEAVVIESGGQQLSLLIGQSFSEATVIPQREDASKSDASAATEQAS